MPQANYQYDHNPGHLQAIKDLKRAVAIAKKSKVLRFFLPAPEVPITLLETAITMMERCEDLEEVNSYNYQNSTDARVL